MVLTRSMARREPVVVSESDSSDNYEEAADADSSSESSEDDRNYEEVDRLLINHSRTTLSRYVKPTLVDMARKRGLETDNRTIRQLVEDLLRWRRAELKQRQENSPKASPHNSYTGSDTGSRPMKRSRSSRRSTRGIKKTKNETTVAFDISPPATPEAIHVTDAATSAPPTTGRRRRRRANASGTDDGSSGSAAMAFRVPNNHVEVEINPPSPPAYHQDQRVPDIDLGQFSKYEIPYTSLEKGDIVGQGAFKDVYRGKLKGQPVAIGELRIKALNDFDMKELEVLHQLRHDNIVKFIGVTLNPASPNNQPISIVTELCENGDLFDYMRAHEAPDLTVCIRLMHDIASGVNYLHTRKPVIIHRDLKSINVLVDDNLRAKINDFGLARIKRTMHSVMHSLVGTSNWQAPEFWSPKPVYTEKVDVYSCGLIFWEIMTWIWPERKYPFEDMNDFQIYENVGRKHQRPSCKGLKKHYPHSLVELMLGMWQPEPTIRPSMREVVQQLEDIIENMQAENAESIADEEDEADEDEEDDE